MFAQHTLYQLSCLPSAQCYILSHSPSNSPISLSLIPLGAGEGRDEGTVLNNVHQAACALYNWVARESRPPIKKLSHFGTEPCRPASVSCIHWVTVLFWQCRTREGVVGISWPQVFSVASFVTGRHFHWFYPSTLLIQLQCYRLQYNQKFHFPWV